MTTEDDFHRWLDLHPDDHATRGVLGDFLQDAGDERGAGYVAMSLWEIYSPPRSLKNPVGGWGWVPNALCPRSPDWLPEDWWHETLDFLYIRIHTGRNKRRDYDDMAAYAFGQLPADRRAALLLFLTRYAPAAHPTA